MSQAGSLLVALTIFFCKLPHVLHDEEPDCRPFGLPVSHDKLFLFMTLWEVMNSIGA